MNSLATITNENKEFCQRALLKELLDKVELTKYGKKTPIPKNEGDNCAWRRFKAPGLTKTALTEGVDPSDVDYTVDKITATVSQYGTWTKITDKLQDTGIDNNVLEASEMFGKHAARTIDSITMDILAAGNTVHYGGDATTRLTVAAGDVMTYALINTITESLKTDNVEKIKMPNGRSGYVCLTPPRIYTQLKNLTEWKDAAKYVTPDMIKQGIVGELDGIYFVDSNLAPVFTGAGAAGIDVYGCILFGADAFGVVDVDGSSKPSLIIKDRKDAGSKLDLYSTVGWKSMFTAKILTDEAVVRIEVAGK
ncbi:MAG: N4-gp56 family major capsid protein [Alteromonadales bacterium]|nr:N4-gp56 family major capsid protein [Alteromonadales bacterium]